MDNNWTSVEAALPDGGDKRYGVAVLATILVYTTNGKSTRSKSIVYFKDGDFFNHHHVWGIKIGEKVFQKVTHWMYLPDLPPKHKAYKSMDFSNQPPIQ